MTCCVCALRFSVSVYMYVVFSRARVCDVLCVRCVRCSVCVYTRSIYFEVYTLRTVCEIVASLATHPDGAVLAVADDQLPLRVEDDARDVVGVPRHGVHLPRLRLVHAPQLYLHASINQ